MVAGAGFEDLSERARSRGRTLRRERRTRAARVILVAVGVLLASRRLHEALRGGKRVRGATIGRPRTFWYWKLQWTMGHASVAGSVRSAQSW